jgi:hypothetical protein
MEPRPATNSRHKAYDRRNLVFGLLVTVSLYVLAAVLLLDSVREPIYEWFGGGYGCGSDGLQAIPALIVLYFATAALVATSRACSVGRVGRAAFTTAIYLGATVAIVATIAVLLVSSGAGCVE